MSKFNGSRGMADSDKEGQIGVSDHRNNQKPTEVLSEDRSSQYRRVKGVAANFYRKKDVRRDRIDGKRVDLDKGKSCWVHKPPSRWNPLPNTAVIIGKSRNDRLTSRSNSSTSEYESNKGEL